MLVIMVRLQAVVRLSYTQLLQNSELSLGCPSTWASIH